MPQKRHLLDLVLASLLLGPLAPVAEAGSKLQAVNRAIAANMARDLKRDAATPATPLRRPMTVHRYTSAQRAQQEAQTGVAPGSHMTARARPGPPLSPERAQKRYGLPQAPTARETIRLPAGTPLKHNRALGGQPGYGEVTTPKRLPPSTVVRIVRLPDRKR